MSTAERVAVHAALLGQVLISAGTYLVARAAVPELGAGGVWVLRLLIAGLTFALLVKLAPGPGPFLPEGFRGKPLEFAALLGGPINQGLFLAGIARSTPSHAALLYALTPVGVYLVARVRLGERPTTRKTLGIGIALFGVLVVLAEPWLAGTATQAGETLVGDLLLLSAVSVWVLYSVENKRLAARVGALRAAGWSAMCGGLLALPFAPLLLNPVRLSEASSSAWLGVAYLGLGTSVASYLMWSFALSRLEASRVAVFANLQPVVTALLARGVSGDPITAPLLAGGVLVMGGVLLTERG